MKLFYVVLTVGTNAFIHVFFAAVKLLYGTPRTKVNDAFIMVLKVSV